MPEYRDPKVTTPTKAGSMGMWIGIALAVLVLLLLLWWFMSGADEAEVTQEPAAVETDPAATAPAETEAAEPAPAN
jgi:Na+-transporting methylmalonyl-CoA/oxaloacetate decarboxylase gamma subunit